MSGGRCRSTNDDVAYGARCHATDGRAARICLRQASHEPASAPFCPFVRADRRGGVQPLPGPREPDRLSGSTPQHDPRRHQRPDRTPCSLALEVPQGEIQHIARTTRGQQILQLRSADSGLDPADLGPLGIRVNALAPGLVQGTRASASTPESVREQILRQTPMGRLATTQDVAGAVMLLASPEAGFITGQLLHVDGGLVMA